MRSLLDLVLRGTRTFCFLCCTVLCCVLFCFVLFLIGAVCRHGTLIDEAVIQDEAGLHIVRSPFLWCLPRSHSLKRSSVMHKSGRVQLFLPSRAKSAPYGRLSFAPRHCACMFISPFSLRVISPHFNHFSHFIRFTLF